MTTTSAPDLLSDAPLGEVTTTGDSRQIVFHRRYRQSVEKVWAALTVPERLADWFATAEVDLREWGCVPERTVRSLAVWRALRPRKRVLASTASAWRASV